MEILLTCTKCKIEKPESEFRNQTSTKTKKKAYCIPCDNLYNKNRYLAKKDKCIEKVLLWQSKNKRKIKGYKSKFLLNKKLKNQPKENINTTILESAEPTVIPINDNIQIC